jgi:translation initiation factor IF-1
MDQQKSAITDDLVYGIVEEALPNTLFRVTVEDEDEPLLAYLSGKMRRFRIRVLVGDKVGMVTDPYGGKARITKRI